jgi:hypothetical protein
VARATRGPSLRGTACAAAFALCAADLHAAAPDARAEVLINLCAASDVIVRALNLRPAESFESWYFESPGRVHQRRGHVFRLRTGSGAPQLTLEVANQDCATVKAELLPDSEAKCEYDLHGTRLAGAVSVSRSLSPDLARALVEGRTPLADVLSPAQVRYLQATGGWPLAADVRRLGPAKVRAYRTTAQKFMVEAWVLPGDERFVEISQKATFGGAPAVQAELVATLDRASVPRCTDQAAQSAIKLDAMLGRK